MFSRRGIKALLKVSAPQRRKLKDAYARLPETRCRRRAHCCSMLPEMTLLEALSSIQRLTDMASPVRKRFVKIIANYFFLNPVEITHCPFLDGRECLIYQDRFFNCRAYGLWSPAYYEILSKRNRQAKINLRKQWETLGVSLPRKVIDFQVPYCLCVESDGRHKEYDDVLRHTAERIDALSRGFSHLHESFCNEYFSDLSFLLTSLVFGVTEAVHMKFYVVRDIITKKDRKRLDRIVSELPDLFAELAGPVPALESLPSKRSFF